MKIKNKIINLIHLSSLSPCYAYKHHLNNIKSGMLGSDGLAIRESLIEDIQSLKDKVAKLSDEISRLTES